MTTLHKNIIPRPQGVPLLGILPSLLRDPFAACMQVAAEGDGLVELAIGPVKAYLVSHAEYVRQILVNNASNYEKGSMMDGIRLALGNGLFTSDGDFWKRQRRLMQPAFHSKQIQTFAVYAQEVIQETIEGWRQKSVQAEVIDLLREATHINIRIIFHALFGTTITSERSERLLELTTTVFRGMTERVWTFFLPRWLPTPGAAAYRRAIRLLDQEIYRIIADGRERQEEQNILLDVLLSIQDEDTGEHMTDQQIRDEIFTIFLAGYESTASSITWATYLLVQHPLVVAKVKEELESVLGQGSPGYLNLPQLPYLRMVMDETLRLYPAFPMFFRTSISSDVLGPYTIPGKAPIILSPYATHHDPRFWEEPETFQPERFSAARFDAQARQAYYPFGKGQRMCIGESMSLVISQLMLATLVQNCTFELAPGSLIQPHYAMTYQPRYGLPLLIHFRSVSAIAN